VVSRPGQHPDARPVATKHPELRRPIDDLPIAVTVLETAAVLRLGRNKVYDLVHQWHATSGAQGLRSVRVGRSVRIPSLAVLELLGMPPAGSNSKRERKAAVS